MVQRVIINGNQTPLRVLDSSGNDTALSCLFDANYRVLRAPYMKGIAFTPATMGGAVATVSYGQAFARPPLVLMQWYGPGAVGMAKPYNERADDNTFTSGGSVRGYVSYAEFMNWANNSAMYFSYLIFKTLSPV